MSILSKFWKYMFLVASLFNTAVAIPIIFANNWSYTLAFTQSAVEGSNSLRLWSDFGFAVFFIGVGYFLVSLNPTKNHGIVWLGIISKLFDVIILSSRVTAGVMNWKVLIPAAIDGLFVILFVWFMIEAKRSNRVVVSGA